MSTGSLVKAIYEFAEQVREFAIASAAFMDELEEMAAQYEHWKKCVRVLRVKSLTLGLTLSERRRLNEMTQL